MKRGNIEYPPVSRNMPSNPDDGESLPYGEAPTKKELEQGYQKQEPFGEKGGAK